MVIKKIQDNKLIRNFKYAITGIQFDNKKNYLKLIHDVGKSK